MSQVIIYLATGAALWSLGLHGLLKARDVFRRIIAVNVMSSGVFMVMVSLAARIHPSDPILQALVVTGLVVAVSATAFALRLAVASSRTRSSEESAENHSS